MRISLLLFICLLQMKSAWAQFDKSYSPVPVLDTVPPVVYRQLKALLETKKSSVQGHGTKMNTYIKDLYDAQFDYVVGNFNKDYFINDQEITPYLQRILDKIYDANPQLHREVSVFAYRSNTPNAISFGNGIIAVTIGLLSKIEDEAQIAFVLCHELAHHHTGHSDLKFMELARLNFDKDLKKEIYAIKSKEYNQYTRLKELFESLNLTVAKHSRTKEFEADSIGFTYFSKTGYDLKAAIRTMEILDSADISKYPENIDLKKVFDFNDYPFKPGWEEYKKATTWHASNDDPDSAQTHPGCELRAVALERQSHRTQQRSFTSKEKITAGYIRSKSEFEMIASYYHFKQYGKAMFYALLLTKKYPENAWLHAIVGRCLYEMYVAQKNHELGKFVELPDPRFDENYDRFLTFIQRLRLMELASLSYHYLISQKSDFFEDEEYLYSLWLCSNLDISKVDPDKVKEDYIEKFPRGRYVNVMK